MRVVGGIVIAGSETINYSGKIIIQDLIFQNRGDLLEVGVSIVAHADEKAK